MKTAYCVVLILMAAPFALGFLGMGLAWAFSCTGMDYISKCSIPAVTGFVSGLVSMFWLAAFAIPLGVIALVVLGLITTIGGASKNEEDS